MIWPTIPGSHTVQLYEDESFLLRAVEEFLAEGARIGGPLVMITRRRTFDAIAARLAPHQILFADAEAMLEQIMDGSTLDPAAVDRAFQGLLTRVAETGVAGTIWVYGEGVNLLCRQNNHQAALQLEQCWNRLIAGCRPMATVCAYAMDSFGSDAHARPLREICRQHTHVVPAESFTDAPDDRARLERVVLLQQRARALGRAEEPRPQPASRTTDASAPRPSTTMSIYIIDDDASVRRSLARLLASVDLEVRTFASAEDFLSDVDESSSGCLILDIQLLGMSGMDLQRRLAAARGRWPIIAMSGAYDARIEEEAVRLGALVFLRKPFPAQSLIDAIARARASIA